MFSTHDARAAAPRDKYALLIGIDHYRVQAYDTLRAPANDVALMRKLLIERYAFSSDQNHIRTITGFEATRGAILGAIQSFLITSARTHPSAEIVLFYSGHGSQTIDGLHQTIVSSDSRTGDVHDITDAELSARFDLLRKYTSNITFILDSCFSSTLIRALDMARVGRSIAPERGVIQSEPPIPSHLVGGFASANPNDNYAAIAASLPNETAREGCNVSPVGTAGVPFDCGPGQRPYGYLTYYLYRSLSLNSQQTYHEVANAVAASVSGSQHPTAQGDIERLVFDGNDTAGDPYIKITSKQGARITIAAGKAFGINEGALVAFYEHGAVRLRGQKGLISGGRVVKVSDFSADAIVDTSNAHVSTDAKVVLVSANPAMPLRVRFPSSEGLSEDMGALRQAIAADPSLAIANGGGWDVSVERSCGGAGAAISAVDDCSPMFYVATPDRDAPLFGVSVGITNPQAFATSLITILDHAAKQRSMRLLANPRSSLAQKLRLRIFKVSLANDASGNAVISSSEPLNTSAGESLKIGQQIQIEIANGSDQDASVVLFDLGTQGTISTLSPRGVALRIPSKTTYRYGRVWKVLGPAGMETFELIGYAYRGDAPPADFAALEQPGVNLTSAKAINSQFSFLAAFAVKGAKDLDVGIDVSPSSWTTDRIDASVLP
jgi:hypothetical protein